MKIVWWGGIDPERGPFVSFRLYTDVLEYTSTKHFRDLYDDPAIFWKVIEKMSTEEVQEGWELTLSMQADAEKEMGNILDQIVLTGTIPKEKT